jgi:hypothetical protein
LAKRIAFLITDDHPDGADGRRIVGVYWNEDKRDKLLEDARASGREDLLPAEKIIDEEKDIDAIFAKLSLFDRRLIRAHYIDYDDPDMIVPDGCYPEDPDETPRLNKVSE